MFRYVHTPFGVPIKHRPPRPVAILKPWGASIVHCLFACFAWSYSNPMDSSQRCRDQAAKCLHLIESAPSKDQAEVLRNISSSWSRLSGQIDRYNELVRKQGRIARK